MDRDQAYEYVYKDSPGLLLIIAGVQIAGIYCCDPDVVGIYLLGYVGVGRNYAY